MPPICLEIYLVIIPQGEKKLLAPSECRAGILLDILQCMVLSSQTTTKDLTHCVNIPMVEKSLDLNSFSHSLFNLYIQKIEN